MTKRIKGNVDRIPTRIPMWTTREGVTIPIRKMATSHLLSTIHFIERHRMEQLYSVAAQIGDEPDAIDDRNFIEAYSVWPTAYEDLLAEAERRLLIKRGK